MTSDQIMARFRALVADTTAHVVHTRYCDRIRAQTGGCTCKFADRLRTASAVTMTRFYLAYMEAEQLMPSKHVEEFDVALTATREKLT